MTEKLENLCHRLEAKRLSLVFSAESGSRAWGFASPNSDYDIRFIFCKDLERYLSLQDGVQDIRIKRRTIWTLPGGICAKPSCLPENQIHR